MKTLDKRNTESGNVLFYILIAVALIAALSFAVSQSGRGNVQQLNAERARLYASEIIEYANNLGNIVTQLKLRSCNEAELNFENPADTGYVNPTAASDNLCDIFHPAGGGFTWQRIPLETRDTTNFYLTDYFINGTNHVSGTKSSAGDLIFLAEIQESVCTAINTLSNIEPADPPAQDTNGIHLIMGAKFKGTFAETSEITAYTRESFACFYDSSTGNNSSDKYFFYKVLISR